MSVFLDWLILCCMFREFHKQASFLTIFGPYPWFIDYLLPKQNYCWVWYKKKVHKFEYMLLSKLLVFLSCCNLILCRVMCNSSEGRSKLWFVNQEEWIKKILKVNFKGMRGGKGGGGGLEKLKKGVGSMVQGQVFLKWVGEKGAGTFPI